MAESYEWDYRIKIKTKEGTFEYEKETLDNLDMLIEKYPEYEELRAERKQVKKLCKERSHQRSLPQKKTY